MASRVGRHEAGTDGLDYSHRERVATHYTASVQNKARLLKTVYCHLALSVLVLIHIAVNFTVGVQIWEAAWLVTAASCVLAILALPRNQVTMLYVFGVINCAHGFGCCSYGMYTSIVEGGDVTVILGCSVAVVIHSLEVFYARKLVSSSTQWKKR